MFSCTFVGGPLFFSWVASSYKDFLFYLLSLCIFFACLHLRFIGCRFRRPEHQCKHCKTLLTEIDCINYDCSRHGGGNDGGYGGGFDADGDCGGGDGGGGD